MTIITKLMKTNEKWVIMPSEYTHLSNHLISVATNVCKLNIGIISFVDYYDGK